MILHFGVLGLIVTSLIPGIATTSISLYWVKKHYELTVDWSSSLKILLSSGVAAALTYVLVLELGFSSLIRLIIGAVFFILVFGAAALLTKVINKSDIENLRGMIAGLGVIGKIFNRVLDIIEKLMKIIKV